MAREIEIRRHTDNDGDVLTAEGVAAALEIGRRLRGDYLFLASSGAQRATQTAACFVAALGERVPDGVIVEAGIRSGREDEWRAAYSRAGAGDLKSLEGADPNLVSDDSGALADGLRRLFERLDDGDRALAIGHSPTNEAAVLGLTGSYIDPMGKGDGVSVVEDGGEYRVAALD
jgi:broad specificity phosphatase PhoE